MSPQWQWELLVARLVVVVSLGLLRVYTLNIVFTPLLFLGPHLMTVLGLGKTEGRRERRNDCGP